MGFLDRFRAPKKERQMVNEAGKSKSRLEEICGDDSKIYDALSSTMFLDPRKIKVSVGEAASSAKSLEKEDSLGARLWYEIAGGLAIHEGDVEAVTKYFDKCEKISPEKKYPILEDPKKAVDKATEYYRKYITD